MKSARLRCIAWATGAALILCASGATTAGETSASAASVRGRLHLFVDAHDIASSRSVTLRMHPPCAEQVVLRLDAPWEGEGSAYATVLLDGPKWRMYYRGGGELTQEVTCVVESNDGVAWTRPQLGLFDFDGSRENNIVWRAPDRKSYGGSHNMSPFIDTNPEAQPDARYKAAALGWHVGADGKKRKALDTLASPDGLHWRVVSRDAVTTGSFDSQNVIFWDEVQRFYRCYLRHGRAGVRSVMLTTSTDFTRWSEPQFLDFSATPLEHFYTNGIVPYFRDPTWYVGLPMRFVPGRTSVGEPARATNGLSDAVLITSRNGIHFDRTFMEAFIRPGLESTHWGNAHGNQTPAWGLHPAGTSHMAVFWFGQEAEVPTLRRGLLRLDGFASLNAGYGGGEAVIRVLAPSEGAGARLVLNLATSAVGSVRVEVQDAEGAPIPGFALADCLPAWGDEIARAMRWRGGDALPAANSESAPNGGVRLRFALMDADLYSFHFVH